MATPRCSACKQKARIIINKTLIQDMPLRICTNCGDITVFLSTPIAGATLTPLASVQAGRNLSVTVPETLLTTRLIAAILHSEEECLVYTELELEEASEYQLVQDTMPDEKSTILTVRKRT